MVIGRKFNVAGKRIEQDEISTMFLF